MFNKVLVSTSDHKKPRVVFACIVDLNGGLAYRTQSNNLYHQELNGDVDTADYDGRLV